MAYAASQRTVGQVGQPCVHHTSTKLRFQSPSLSLSLSLSIYLSIYLCLSIYLLVLGSRGFFSGSGLKLKIKVSIFYGQQPQLSTPNTPDYTAHHASGQWERQPRPFA